MSRKCQLGFLGNPYGFIIAIVVLLVVIAGFLALKELFSQEPQVYQLCSSHKQEMESYIQVEGFNVGSIERGENERCYNTTNATVFENLAQKERELGQKRFEEEQKRKDRDSQRFYDFLSEHIWKILGAVIVIILGTVYIKEKFR